MNKKNQKNLREQVYDSIIEDILSGQYRKTDIITESDLIKKYSISKSPVRDALIELCNENILQSIPRLGYAIVNYSNEHFDGVFHFREWVEPYYLNLYWERLTPESIQALIDFDEQLQTGAEAANPISYWRNNQQFHLKLAEQYHDDFYYELLKLALKRQIFIFAQHYWSDWNRDKYLSSVGNHKALLKALAGQERAESVRLLQEGLKRIKTL